jgi:LUC7 N_terminus
MVDYQRQLLDELMGRNRNLDPGQKVKDKSWKDTDNCKFFMVSEYFIDCGEEVAN